MNTPIKITVSNWMGREVNPFSKALVRIGAELEYLCPSIENTKPGEKVWAYQVMQERNPNATNAFDWHDCVMDGYDPICKTGWEQRIIWRPVNAKIVEQKEGEGKFGEWVSVEDRLPELGERVLCLEGFQQNSKSPIKYRAEIAVYCIDKVFGDRKGNPVFMNEQDEQPGTVSAYYWMPLDDQNWSLPSPPITEK